MYAGMKTEELLVDNCVAKLDGGPRRVGEAMF